MERIPREQEGTGEQMRVAWSAGTGESGTAQVGVGQRFVVARRMDAPGNRLLTSTEVDGSHYLFVRLPYVSDPALVFTATDAQPVLFRGQRANGAIVEVHAGAVTVPDPQQKLSLPAAESRVVLRLPDLVLEVAVSGVPAVSPAESGTTALGVAALEADDAWLVAALAVTLSREPGIVTHDELKSAFEAWRSIAPLSVGAFDRNVLRPALLSRGIELPGPRLNKIVYLVERCRATGEFPAHIQTEVRARAAATAD